MVHTYNLSPWVELYVYEVILGRITYKIKMKGLKSPGVNFIRILKIVKEFLNSTLLLCACTWLWIWAQELRSEDKCRGSVQFFPSTIWFPGMKCGSLYSSCQPSTGSLFIRANGNFVFLMQKMLDYQIGMFFDLQEPYVMSRVLKSLINRSFWRGYHEITPAPELQKLWRK